jgi:hydroxymethylbilane synthase
LEKIKTKGDRITDVPLAKVGGKGLFVKEIEDALIRAKIDFAVHSMKDVPTALPEGLQIIAITGREDFRDALISKNNLKLIDMPPDSRIGTSSLRRQAQLLNLYPGFQMIPLRGNLDTRLKKLMTSSLDAIVVAGAGVKRLDLECRISEYISPDIMLPAIGQGALGIESRIDDNRINEIVSFLNSTDSEIAITAERQFLERLGGGCQVPIAALGEIYNGVLSLSGIVSSIDGKILLRDSIQGSPDNPTVLGERLAQRLLDKGAAEILREIYPTAY